MKTITYHTANEIKFGMMIAIFTFAIFTTIKVREIQVTDMNNSNRMSPDKTELSNDRFLVFPAPDAKLIEEPAFESGTTLRNDPNSSKNQEELAVQMKTWMNKSTYWSDEATVSKEELALQMTTWIENGDYWSSISE
jgi:hypothetical protein